ncbi:Uncharacterized protein RNJ44_02964 [Nakaseomyces bracarensis]|uniref:Nucleoporin n=1 Tax=Nakaseomyces bracarensis TaxID=273131 RepID=A0ABR4P0V8_9SACH
MQWSVDKFRELYSSIQSGLINADLFNELLPDLKNLLQYNANSSEARSKLENLKEFTLSDGSSFKLTQDFIISIAKISDELHLNEIYAVNLVLENSDGDQIYSNEIINEGKISFFLRRQYILQITSYFANVLDQNDSKFSQLFGDNNKFTEDILASFDIISKQLSEIKQEVNRHHILENNDIIFKQGTKFKRDFLSGEYDLLSQILYGLSKRNIFTRNLESLKSVINYSSKLESSDIFVVYFLPTIINVLSNLNAFEDQHVFTLHKELKGEITNKQDEIYKTPFKVLSIFIFLTYMIGWCKDKPDLRVTKLNFKTDIDDPMTIAVELGAIELLLIIIADISDADVSNEILYYDFRLLLERHLPRLLPKQLIDDNILNEYTKMPIFPRNNNKTITSNTGSSIGNNFNSSNNTVNFNNGLLTQNRLQTTVSQLNLNPRMSANEKKHVSLMSKINSEALLFKAGLSELFLTFFSESVHNFFQTFISDCAFLLTKLKDAEEDSLLSGEDLDLDDIAVKADLERFFLSIYYFYASKPTYCAAYWDDKESAAYGFIEWASKCNDNLMKSCYYLMLGSLSSGQDNALNVYYYFGDANPTSWKKISEIIEEYSKRIINISKIVQSKEQENAVEVNPTILALEEGLNEETIVYLSSLLTLITSVTKGLDVENKITLLNLLLTPLFSFLTCDTPLVGACFNTISHLVPNLESERAIIWHQLDRLLFKSNNESNVSGTNAFASLLTNYTDVLGFLDLLDKLLAINTTACNGKYLRFGTLQYPTKLGSAYRKVGVWPYIEFIFSDIFVDSEKISDPQKKLEIQNKILHIAQSCLYSFDYSVILNSITVGANLDNLVNSDNFFSYIQETCATAFFNQIYQEKVYTALFSIASMGIDEFPVLVSKNSQVQNNLSLALSIINATLEHEGTFVEEMINIIKRAGSTNYAIPKYFGSHGLKSFYETIFFNLKFVAYLGLYIGLDNNDIPVTALDILFKLSNHFNSTEPDPVIGDKLFTLFDSVDESARIKDAFICQIDNTITTESNLQLKIRIIEFLVTNLNMNPSKPNLAHVLLGFQSDKNFSLGPSFTTFISSGTSLFQSIINLLISALNELTGYEIDYAPMRIAATSLELIEILCKSSLTGNIVIDYISDKNIIKQIMDIDPQISKHTKWNGRSLEQDLDSSKNNFINSESIGAYLEFLKYRTSIIQFLSGMIHSISLKGTVLQVTPYTNYLVSNSIYSARIFSLLDPLHYDCFNNKIDNTDSLDLFKNLPVNLERINRKETCTGNIFDFSELDSLLELHQRTYSIALSKSEQFNAKVNQEITAVKESITEHLVRTESFKLQLGILHNWVQLVQIIVSDGNLDSQMRNSFILEVFDMVTPKISVYVDLDVTFAEELVSLMVFLFHIYNQSTNQTNNQHSLDSKLHNLFKVCIRGITSPLSSLNLRSDFYVIANNYLVKILKNSQSAIAIIKDLRINSEKLVDVICNDAIYGEGSNRITGLLLLDSLVRLANYNKENFIVTTLGKSTKLLHIIRSLRNTDSLLNSTTENINLDNLLYELTAFKATAYLLIRIAESREGAASLMQNKIFQILGELSFLKIDPDLGLELVFDEFSKNSSSILRVNITLDDPLLLENENNSISIFELIIPIFQLITAILISSGSSNKAIINETKSLLEKYRKLILGTFKRDLLWKSGKSKKIDNHRYNELQEFIKLIVILCTMTGYRSGEKTSN